MNDIFPRRLRNQNTKELKQGFFSLLCAKICFSLVRADQIMPLYETVSAIYHFCQPKTPRLGLTPLLLCTSLSVSLPNSLSCHVPMHGPGCLFQGLSKRSLWPSDPKGTGLPPVRGSARRGPDWWATPKTHIPLCITLFALISSHCWLK